MEKREEINNRIEEIIDELPDYVKQSIYYDYENCKYQCEYDTTDAIELYYKSLNDYGLNGWVDADDVIQYAIANGFNPDNEYIDSDDNYKKELALELIENMDLDGTNTINLIKEFIDLQNDDLER
jgi:hypothetical protein